MEYLVFDKNKMKLYWFQKDWKEFITYKETKTPVYDTEEWKGLLFWSWQKIGLNEWLEAIKQDGRYVTIETRKMIKQFIS